MLTFATLAAAVWGAASPPPPAGLIDAAVVDGARSATEIRAAFTPLEAALRACDSGARDVVVEVRLGAAGGVAGASVVAFAVGDEGRVSVACVEHVVEGVALADRGREPSTQLLLRFGPPAPPLPWSALKKALKKNRADIARCVDVARRVDPGLSSVVDAALHLDKDGRVVSVDGTGAPALVDCVRDALEGSVVDGFADHVVKAPFVFDALDKDARAPVEAQTLFGLLGCALPIP